MRRMWLLPLAVLIAVAAALAGKYVYERAVTKAALRDVKKGEALALKGRYQDAEALFQSALKKRPNFPGAQLDLKIVRIGETIQKNLAAAKRLENAHKYDEALKRIDQTERHLQNYRGKLVDQLLESISNARITATVGQLREEMNGKTRMDELAPILRRAESLGVPEAKQIADEIRKQIIAIAYADANRALNEKQFSDALQKVEDGLQYAPQNGKLLALKTAIKKAKAAYEKQEQERMQAALAAAQSEYDHNSTDAVELIDVKPVLNKYGDLTIKGTVKSTATVPISTVSVRYELYDKDGHLYTRNEVYVTPDTLNPGDKGTFSYTHLMANGPKTVKVTGFKWYLNE
jgi:tetratricopeptide (TPR) repeat protein